MLDQWAFENGIRLHFITPGKPVENAYGESFRGKLWDECLNEHWLGSLSENSGCDRGLAGRLQSGTAA